ncbi:MAG: cold shock domain-containing protein [Gammaproteobacteria bacterium]|nr:cold shock domain-containing protein [Gammaproteobacteria bacterium]
MRVQGTLKKWNDDRGFGFITLPQSHEEIFVHILENCPNTQLDGNNDGEPCEQQWCN